MLPRKYQRFVFSFFMAFLMSCLMSLVITLFNVGLVENLAIIWLKAWGFAFLIAFPAVTIIAPIVHQLTDWVLDNDSESKTK
jgi:hypothetical protein